MKNYRNILLLIGFVLFVLWYGGTWAYRTQYKEPRAKLNKAITDFEAYTKQFQANIATMQTFLQGNQNYYYRSLPRIPNSARMLYQNWLLELGQFCGIEEPQIDSYNPTQAAYGYAYRFQMQGRLSSEGLARFLYEFYWAPFLHRIASLQITPIEKSENMKIDAVFEGAALYPPSDPNAYYPLRDKLPEGYFKRLASGPFATYASVANRSLTQYARPGLDKADYTYLTAVNYVNGVPEIWLTDRTAASGEPIVVHLNDKIRIGSFVGTLVEAEDENVIFDLNGRHWLLTNGECLNRAFALPPEAR